MSICVPGTVVTPRFTTVATGGSIHFKKLGEP